MKMINDPRKHLRDVAVKYPQVWKQMDMFRQDKGKGLPDWPDWCYCPLAAAYAVVSGGGSNTCNMENIADVALVGGLAAWRVTQGIYRFDPALYQRLIETPVSGEIPVEVLYQLPEWCVYVETPGLSWIGSPVFGFFAHLEYDVSSDGRQELRLLLDLEDGLMAQPLHLTASTIDGALEGFAAEAGRHGGPPPVPGALEKIGEYLPPILSLLLYLCTPAADYGGEARPTKPRPKKTKKGFKIFPPNQPRQWDVGVRMGAALRRAYQAQETGEPAGDNQGERQRPRPHIRRAHWHTYRTGKGRSSRILKWIPPIPVNLESVDDLPATVREVKE